MSEAEKKPEVELQNPPKENECFALYSYNNYFAFINI